MSKAQSLPALLAIGALCMALWWSKQVFEDPNHAPHFRDTQVYWDAGQAARQHRTAYDVTGHYQFNYPPFAAVAYGQSIGRFPLDVASRGWYRISLLGWCTVMLWTLLRFSVGRRYGSVSTKLKERMLQLALLIGTYVVALRDETKLGQTTLVPALVFVLFAELHWLSSRTKSARRRFVLQILQGCVVGFGIQMKIYMGIILLPLLLKREFTVAVVAGLSHFLLYNGPLLALAHGPRFAWAEHTRWLQSMVRYTDQHALTDYFNVSVPAIAAKQLGREQGRWVAIPLTLLILGGLVRAARRTDTLHLCAMALFAVLLINPVVWPYWLLLGCFHMSRVFREHTLPFSTGWKTWVVAMYLLAVHAQNTDFVSRGWLTLGALIAWFFSSNPDFFRVFERLENRRDSQYHTP